MPRTDHDDDRDTPGHDWRRRLVTWCLVAAGLGLGFLIPYTLYLNHQLGERFGQLQWQLPTRVYARPLRLEPGLAMDAKTLEVELRAASYHDGAGVRPGSFLHEEDRWLISSRGFHGVAGVVAPRRIEVRLAGGRVAELKDADSDKKLKAALLNPARIATLYGQKQEERRLVQMSQVPELLITGLQAVEDRDFKDHHGIDISGILRAAWANLRAGETVQGASTLTQQLARSGLLGIGNEQTYARKLNEMLYAILIEARYSKRAIMEAYLNQVYLGQRGSRAIRGVAAAAEFWFDRPLEDLGTEQIALMIGLVKGPSAYDPRDHPERALARRNFVLGEMHETGLIDEAAYRKALAAPLGIAETPGNPANRYPAYVDLVRRQLARDYPADALAGAGLRVMTAMSPSAQIYAEQAVADTLDTISTKNRPPLQAGLVMTDVDNGDVLAVVGSRQFTRPGFNRAVQARRPVGSLLKPFVYLLALAQPGQWSLASWVDDSDVTVRLGNGKRWSPDNSGGRSHGRVRLIDALAHSYNQATVRLGMQVDPRRIADLIHTLAGIEADPNPSLILGATGQSPYAMAQLYQFLASGGQIQPLHAVRGVLDVHGLTLNRYDTTPAPAQAGDTIAARLVTLALQHAVTSGTGRALVRDGLGHLDAAGKTGTTNDGRDSWFAGYTGDHLAVIWVGNDANKATGLYGATGALRVWSDIFSNLPSAALEVGGKGLDWQWVVGSHSSDASCPGARRFAFVAGFVPPYQSCIPEPAPYQQADDDGGGWRDWFGWGDDDEASTPEPARETPQ